MLDFVNQNPQVKTLYIEPLGEGIDIQRGMEYRIAAEENEFYLVFSPADVTLYLQRTVGFLLYMRPISDLSSNRSHWMLLMDRSDF